MNSSVLEQPVSADAALSGRVLVVDDHARARESISDALVQAGHRVDCVSSAVEALRVMERDSFDVVVTDLMMPGMDGLELLRQLERRPHGAQLVMITGHATIASAVEAIRHGAFDYLEKPFDAGRLEQVVSAALGRGRRLDRRNLHPDSGEPEAWEMVGSGPAMQSLRQRIALVAPTLETVLIEGESGTGKELVARALHAASGRRGAPLVDVNCPALVPQLAESELFGHTSGAFTGADAARAGRFELAHGGTIFLDEITEIELPLQAKLLRVLQERTIERVGSSQKTHVNVRVLAATNRDLHAEVSAGRFRSDLFFRLHVVPLHVPPLRERREDVPELIEHFLRRSARRLNRDPCTLEPPALQLLLDYHWPGNVRELGNLLTRASVLSTGAPIRADELRTWLIDAGATPEPRLDQVLVGLSLDEMERTLIEATLAHYDGHRARTAQALGIGLRTLSGKLKQYGYQPREKRAIRSA
jgi:DNA-binding NtrC family response regulator